MLSPSTTSLSHSPTSNQEVDTATDRGQQQAPLQGSTDSHPKNKTPGYRGRKPLAQAWHTLNYETLGSPLDLLNNKKRNRELETTTELEDDQPTKKRLSLDTTTLISHQKGIVAAVGNLWTIWIVRDKQKTF